MGQVPYKLGLVPAKQAPHRPACHSILSALERMVLFIYPLQGSAGGGCEWVDLRRHVDDASIRRPGQMTSWPVLGPAASSPYRAFRLLLEGPTTAGGTGLAQGQGHCLCVSNLELYGYLYRVESCTDSTAGGGTSAAEGAGAVAATGAGPLAA